MENTKSYKVVRVYRNSGNRKLLGKNLTEAEAQRIVKSYPYREKSIVVYFKQII